MPTLNVAAQIGDRRPAALGEQDWFDRRWKLAGRVVAASVKMKRRAKQLEGPRPSGQFALHVSHVHELQGAALSRLSYAEQREDIRRGQRCFGAIGMQASPETRVGVPSPFPFADGGSPVTHFTDEGTFTILWQRLSEQVANPEHRALGALHIGRKPGEHEYAETSIQVTANQLCQLGPCAGSIRRVLSGTRQKLSKPLTHRHPGGVETVSSVLGWTCCANR